MLNAVSQCALKNAAHAAWTQSASVQIDEPLPRDVWVEGWSACAEHLRLDELCQAFTLGKDAPGWEQELAGQLLRLGVPALTAQEVAARVCRPLPSPQA